MERRCVVCRSVLPKPTDVRQNRKTCPPPKECTAIRRRQKHNASAAENAKKRRAEKIRTTVSAQARIVLANHAARARMAPAGYLEPIQMDVAGTRKT